MIDRCVTQLILALRCPIPMASLILVSLNCKFIFSRSHPWYATRTKKDKRDILDSHFCQKLAHRPIQLIYQTTAKVQPARRVASSIGIYFISNPSTRRTRRWSRRRGSFLSHQRDPSSGLLSGSSLTSNLSTETFLFFLSFSSSLILCARLC